MQDSLIILLGEMFVARQDKYEKGTIDEDGYILIKFHVPLKTLSSAYDRFVREGIEPIEEIGEELKNKFWNIAKRYYTDQALAIKASKAAYVLSLITAT